MNDTVNNKLVRMQDAARELTSKESDLVSGGFDWGSVWHNVVGYVDAADRGAVFGYNLGAKQPVAQVPLIGQAFVAGSGLGALIGGVYAHSKGKF